MDRLEEGRPFLTLEEDEREHIHDTNDQAKPSHGSNNNTQPRKAWITLLPLSAMMLVLGFARTLSSLSLFMAERESFCNAYLASHPPGNGTIYDDKCQSATGDTAPEVLEKQENILLWDRLFELVPSLIVVLPLGLVADRFGRKRVLVFSLGVVTLSQLIKSLILMLRSVLPRQLTWLASALGATGGGYAMVTAISFALAAEVATRSNMFTTFLFLGAAEHLGKSLGMAVAALVDAPVVWFALTCLIHGLALAFALAINMEDTDGPSLLSHLSRFDASQEIAYLLDIKRLAADMLTILRIFYKENKRLTLLLLVIFFSSITSSMSAVSAAAIPFASLCWVLIALLLSVFCGCCAAPLSKDLWLARVLAIIALPAVADLMLSSRPHPLEVLFSLMLIGSLDVFPLVLKSAMLQLKGDGKDSAAAFAVFGLVQNASALVQWPVGALLSAIGLDGGVMGLVLFFVAVVLLCTIWPRPTDVRK